MPGAAVDNSVEIWVSMIDFRLSFILVCRVLIHLTPWPPACQSAVLACSGNAEQGGRIGFVCLCVGVVPSASRVRMSGIRGS